MRAKLLLTIVVITGLIFGIFLFSPNILSLNHSTSAMAQTDDSVSLSPFSLSNLIEQDSPYLGNLTAPITIIDVQGSVRFHRLIFIPGFNITRLT